MPENVASALRLKLGALNVIDGAKTPFGARVAAFPADAEQATQAVAQAVRAGMPIVPAGGGVSVDAVYPVSPDAMLLSSLRLNRIEDYQPENMVVTAQTGVTMTALNETLRRHRQFLPLNPPRPDVATVGGVVAAAASGPWRAYYGGVRDFVLEVCGVDASARAIRGGARVVKNAAGYDLPKLYVGSRGTLAFLTSVTFMTRPLPETSTRLLFSAPTWDALHERLTAVAASDLRPAVLEVQRSDLRDTQPRPDASIVFEGAADTVAWQVEQCLPLLRGGGCSVARMADPLTPPERTGDVELTIRVRPSRTATMVSWLVEKGWRGAAAYYPMEGRISLCLVAYPDTPDRLQELRAIVEEGGGAVTVERMPLVWTGRVSPWGAERADARLALAIKQRLDPDGVFINPVPGVSGALTAPPGAAQHGAGACGPVL